MTGKSAEPKRRGLKKGQHVSSHWVKGQSGNPFGCSATRLEAYKVFKAELQKEIIDTGILIDAMRSGVKKGDVTFCRLCLEYTYGKPKETIDVNSTVQNNSPLASIPYHEVLTILKTVSQEEIEKAKQDDE